MRMSSKVLQKLSRKVWLNDHTWPSMVTWRSKLSIHWNNEPSTFGKHALSQTPITCSGKVQCSAILCNNERIDSSTLKDAAKDLSQYMLATVEALEPPNVRAEMVKLSKKEGRWFWSNHADYNLNQAMTSSDLELKNKSESMP